MCYQLVQLFYTPQQWPCLPRPSLTTTCCCCASALTGVSAAVGRCKSVASACCSAFQACCRCRLCSEASARRSAVLWRACCGALEDYYACYTQPCTLIGVLVYRQGCEHSTVIALAVIRLQMPPHLEQYMH
eukprot:20703-Heterococcus_DN1.PRE.1